ncbi:MAG: NACHT domain-containing protein, partial [bacterium]|nr:NACHT domain-containing protein [bacterium]
EGYREALHFLNAHREDLRLAPGAVLLWLTTPALGDVLEQAPDFADWQTAGATFALPPGRQIERTALGRLSITEAEELRRQIRRCEEMLARPNLGSALTAELKKQLDTGERRLGRVADVRRDYRLHLVDELREHVMRGFAPQVGGRVLSLPLAKIFLPLKALEGRPALAEYAADDLRWQEAAEDLDELGWQQRREEMEKRYAQLQARQSAQRTLGLQELLKERRAVLLGDPGTGKTTMARYVAYALAADDLIHVGEAVRGLLPVLVRLADFGEALRADRELTLPDYVESRLMPQPAFGACLREAIEGSECLVILDGLDEVTDPDLRIEVTARIQALVSAFGGNRFLVTSRIVGYERSPLTRNFKHATLQELEADDKERFVELWYGAIRSEIHDRSLAAGEAELTEALQKKPQIARMAANPLLLTIMVLMHWRGVKLPSRRVQVYQNATDTLIEYWTAERVELDAEEVKQILAPIAHYILSS